MEEASREAAAPFAVLHVGEERSQQLLDTAVAQCGHAVQLEWRQVHAERIDERIDEKALDPEVVVVGAEIGAPLQLAQTLRERFPLAQFLFLLPEERLPHFRSGLPFVPHMAGAWTAAVEAAPKAVAAVLAQAAQVARRKREAVQVRQAINQRLVALGATEDMERRLEQMALSESYLAALLAQAPDAFIAIATEGTVLAWNTAAERIIGLPADGAVGKACTAVLPPALVGLIEVQLAGGEAIEAFERRELSLRDPKGELRWFDCSMAPVRDAAGRTVSLSITLRDVSERHVAEARVRASEQRYRMLVEALPQLVWTSLPDGRCDYLSRQWLDYTGTAEASQLGFGWLEAVHPDDRERTKEQWQRAVGGQSAYDVEFRLQGRDSNYRWFKTRATPVHDAKGNIEYWFGTCTDIQDIIEAREALSRSAEELEERVATEVAERGKLEEALHQAQKMEAIGQLTGGIAHDFNNLLQGISGSLELLQRQVERGVTSSLDRLLQGALGSTQRAAALIHRLLAFSRRQPLAPRIVETNPLVDTIEDLLRRTLGEHIRLELQLADGLWLTRCDPNQLESAILNLVINARDAMPDGGLLIIETANVWLDAAYARQTGTGLRPGPYVCIAVSDTGTGMSADVLAHAVDPFFTTKPIGQGSGLGLSMIYGFAGQSEGHLQIYSEVGIGTTVKLYLPRCGEGPAEATAVRPAEQIEQAPDARTILVVEDEPVVRQLVVEVLSELGHRVLAAADGSEGLRLLQEEGVVIDLLVTDIGLPGLNGRQLAEAAQALRPGLRVLFMSGYAENAAIRRGWLAPGMSLITKPFTIEALAGRVRAIVEQGGHS